MGFICKWSIYVKKQLVCSTEMLCWTYTQKEKNRKSFYGILGAFISLGSTYLKEWAPELYSTVQLNLFFILQVQVLLEIPSTSLSNGHHVLVCSLAVVFSCGWVLGAWISFDFLVSSLLPISHRHMSRTYQKVRVRETCLSCAANDEICDDPMVIWGPYSAIKS